MNDLELLVEAKALLGEIPLWDEQKNILYWADTFGKKLYTYDYKSGSNEFLEFEQPIGSMALDQEGNLIMGLQHGIYSFNINKKKLKKIIDPEPEMKITRYNDGKCDAKGRFWTGTIATQPNSKTKEYDPIGTLYCFESNFSYSKKIEGLRIANGLAWSIDNKTMYYTDSSTGVINAYDFNLDTGEISNKRIAVRIPENEGLPDGMTIDEEGMLWVGHWNGYRISRFNPDTGEKLEDISIPAKNVTCCTFGGDAFDELFVTTATFECDESNLKVYPNSGGLYKIKLGVKGLPAHRFK